MFNPNLVKVNLSIDSLLNSVMETLNIKLIPQLTETIEQAFIESLNDISFKKMVHEECTKAISWVLRPIVAKTINQLFDNEDVRRDIDNEVKKAISSTRGNIMEIFASQIDRHVDGGHKWNQNTKRH